MLDPRKFTNSTFRTHQERVIVRKLRKAGTLREALIAIGASPEQADEFLDDPEGGIPTSVRRLLVSHDH